MRAPETGDLPRKTLPNVYAQLDEFGFHGLTTSAWLILIRAEPVARAAVRRIGAAGAGRRGGGARPFGCGAPPVVGRKRGRLFGGGKSVLSPPMPNTISPGRTPPFEDVGVPPIVI